MATGWKIALGILAALAVLVGLNALAVSGETREAETTLPDGRILELNGGDLQVVDRGPRGTQPIVLIHCFTCAIDWWEPMMPRLEAEHRVVAVDLLGHGGSEKPTSGYSIANQADLVAQALGRLGVSGAEVVGHSLGGVVAVALAERSPRLVERLVIVDTPPEEEDDLGFVAQLGFTPVIGQAFWRLKPDFAVRRGLEVAFAPGFEVPDVFVEDVDRMTYSAYDGSHDAFSEYMDEEALDARIRATGKPLLVIMGAEEQINRGPGGRPGPVHDDRPLRARQPDRRSRPLAERRGPRDDGAVGAGLRGTGEDAAAPAAGAVACKTPCRIRLAVRAAP